jgi:hypothetical protein
MFMQRGNCWQHNSPITRLIWLLGNTSRLPALQRAAAVVEARWWATSEKYASTNGVYLGIDGASALSVYQEALNKGWVTASGAPGATSDGGIIYGTTTPTGNYPVFWNNEFFGLGRDEAGLNSLHEALHQFPGFDDSTLANAARFVDGQNQRDYSSERDPVGAASRNLNELIKNYCGAR